jgi:predicted dehydrogenase
MIRIGLVGCGHIGTVHAYVLHQLAEANLIDAELFATFDADPERAARVARHHGGDAAGSLAELVAGVDVVWVCTWTAAHLEAVEVAVSAGRPVFCEKPLGPALVGAERVATLLGQVPHQVGLVLRWSPVFQRAAEIITSGEFGRPLATVLRDDQYFPIQGFYGSTWRKDVASAGGGTLIEHSIHDVDVLRWLLGDPVSVSARTASRFGHPGIEDTAAVTFAFDDGSVAQLTSVWHQVLTRESGRHLEVFCEAAALWTDDDYLGPLHVQTSDGAHEVVTALPDWAGLLTVPAVYAKPIAHYGTAAKAFLDGLSPTIGSQTGAAQVGGGFPGAAEALAAHRLVDEAYRSAASGGVPVPTGRPT